MSNVCDLLSRRAAERANAPAITQRRGLRDVTLTYGQLERAVSAESRRLIGCGLVPGDRVLVLCPVGLELYVAILGMLRCGLTAVFVDPGAGLGRLEGCCERAQPRAVIASGRAWLLRPWLRGLRWGPRWLSVPRLRGGSAAGGSSRPVTVGPAHPATLTFTSGSTGEPRGVVRTHGFLDAQRRAVADCLQLEAGQTELSTMPVFVLANLAAGVHSVLADADLARPAKVRASRLVRQIMRRRPDRVLASPALLERLADCCLSRDVRLDMLRRIDTGGAPVFPRTLDKLRRAMPRARLMVVYGSTEAEPIAMYDATRSEPAEHARIARGEGLPAGEVAADLDVRLLRPAWGEAIGAISGEAFGRRCVGPGEVGEIVVSGGRVNGGYLDGVGDAETKLRVEGAVRHRTGDLGRFDGDGRLRLLGRAAAQVHDRRGTLEPLAVEAAAMAHVAVARCALLSLEGERVLAVQLATGVDARPAALKFTFGCLLADLAWARIDRIRPLREIPVDRRHNAKIDYPALHRQLQPGARAARRVSRTVPAAPSISTSSPS